MILMYHHVAPLEVVPLVCAPNEGWHLLHTPAGVEHRLIAFRKRNYRFVSLAEIVDEIRKRGVGDNFGLASPSA
jgi:hypothetical protein